MSITIGRHSDAVAQSLIEQGDWVYL